MINEIIRTGSAYAKSTRKGSLDIKSIIKAADIISKIRRSRSCDITVSQDFAAKIHIKLSTPDETNAFLYLLKNTSFEDLLKNRKSNIGDSVNSVKKHLEKLKLENGGTTIRNELRKTKSVLKHLEHNLNLYNSVDIHSTVMTSLKSEYTTLQSLINLQDTDGINKDPILHKAALINKKFSGLSVEKHLSRIWLTSRKTAVICSASALIAVILSIVSISFFKYKTLKELQFSEQLKVVENEHNLEIDESTAIAFDKGQEYVKNAMVENLLKDINSFMVSNTLSGNYPLDTFRKKLLEDHHNYVKNYFLHLITDDPKLENSETIKELATFAQYLDTDFWKSVKSAENADLSSLSDPELKTYINLRIDLEKINPATAAKLLTNTRMKLAYQNMSDLNFDFGLESPFIAPLSYYTSLPGYRSSPDIEDIGGSKELDRYHYGLDAVTLTGIIKHMKEGVVSHYTGSENPRRLYYSSDISAYGNFVVTEHDARPYNLFGQGTERFYILYGHLKNIPDSIKLGQRVRAGDFLGVQGNTGQSSGPHTHIEVFAYEKTTDSQGKQLYIRRNLNFILNEITNRDIYELQKNINYN